nr:hypothetical protein [Tanacetum cinerariifolium]
MMMKRIDELEHVMANLIQENKGLEERLDKHGARLYTLEQLDIPHQVSKAVSEVVTEVIDWAMQAPLRNRFKDLPEADMKEIIHQRMWETESYKSHEDHMQLFEALEKSMNRDHSGELAQDLAETRKKKKKSRESPKTPPIHLISHILLLHQQDHQKIQELLDPLKCRHYHLHLHPPIKKVNLEMDADMGPDEQAQSSNDEDIRSAHILEVNLRQDWWKPIEEERPATPEPVWSISSSDVPVPTNNWASALASNFSPPPEDSLLAQTSDIATFMDWFYLEYLRYGSKGSRPALPISKMKATYYPDAGLEQMVPDQFWIKEECKYDIVAMYGISHWWFQRQRFYIDRHTSEGDRNAVKIHIRILSVMRIEVFSMYGYDYMKKIVPRHADLNEHVISERDFKYLYPSDFEDLYLLNLQEDFQLGIGSYQTQLNLTKPQWDATGFEYKHDYTVIDSSRAIMFRDRYGFQMMIHFNEIHKFSVGTLQQVDEALDYRVKEFRINRINPSLNTRFWTSKDVDRSKAFMFAIQNRLKTRGSSAIWRALLVDASERKTIDF